MCIQCDGLVILLLLIVTTAFDVLANFQMSEIRVHEQTTVSVCVQSWSVKVQQGVMVLVTTHSGTAIGGGHVCVCVCVCVYMCVHGGVGCG